MRLYHQCLYSNLPHKFEKLISDRDYTMMHQIGNKWIQYTGCKILSSSAECECGIKWINHQGSLSHEVVESIKKHISECPIGKVTFSQQWAAKDRKVIPYEAGPEREKATLEDLDLP